MFINTIGNRKALRLFRVSSKRVTEFNNINVMMEMKALTSTFQNRSQRFIIKSGLSLNRKTVSLVSVNGINKAIINTKGIITSDFLKT